MNRLRLLAVVAALGLVGVVAGVWVTSGDSAPGTTAGDVSAVAEYDYTIPAGAGARIDAGEQLDIVPAELVVRVGESIRIVNDDDRGHVVGIFYVGAGETMVQSFTSAGELSGDCSVHPSGQFTLKVLPA